MEETDSSRGRAENQVKRFSWKMDDLHGGMEDRVWSRHERSWTEL